MTDTVYCDVSQFQVPVNDSYPYEFFCFRTNDGTYHDTHASKNLAWAKKAADAGRIAGFIVYAVYRPGKDWVGTLKSVVGEPHPKMAVMIDVESWGGQITGNRSSDINAGRSALASWLGDARRVIGYGNAGDLNSLWPSRGDTQIVLAAYGSNPSFPNKIAHQYSSSGDVPPFGHPVDMNSADGYSPEQFAARLGLAGGSPTPAPAPEPDTDTGDEVSIDEEDEMFVNIQGKSGVRNGGPHYIENGRATFLGGPNLQNVPTLDFDQGTALAKRVSGIGVAS